MEAASIKTNYPELLNDLVKMQEASIFAYRKTVLADAERAIVTLEAKVAKLEAKIVELEAPVKASLL